MHVFIVRPFGVKQGIDFDAVERVLIQPALAGVGIQGSTTGEIVKAGNIRHSMFQLLLTADLVIADISIHNANVFYELGIRHALRDKRTILIRCDGADVPFDLKTDRYLPYDKGDPAGALATLAKSLRDTIASEDADSPVFLSLPELEAQDQGRFIAVPRGFHEAVAEARAKGWRGDVRLLAEEVRGLSWEREGLRVVGRAQFSLVDYAGSKETWERIRDAVPDDFEANLLLGTIYQRLEDLARSDQAIERVLSHKRASASDRAEAFALMGRNAKARWLADWEHAPEATRPERALQSPHLMRAMEACEQGYLQDLNHFFSGINALALVTVVTDLAARLPEVWTLRFDADADAGRRLKALIDRREQLQRAVALSLRAAKDRLDRLGKDDVWLDITRADLRCLTLDRPERVAQAYRQAFHRIDPFSVESAARQLRMLEALGVKPENVRSAVQAIGDLAPASAPREAVSPHVLLFTGHMIDQVGRAQPRFPADMENAARQAILDHVSAERERAGRTVVGMAGCACGGDILFHEVCLDLGIESTIFLALPEERYIVTSVQHGGPQWVDRFKKLTQRLASRVLSPTEALPGWLQEKAGYTIWQRANLWILFNALAAGGPRTSMIALWDGKGGDGPGGTEDMVAQARERGAAIRIIDTNARFAH